MSAPTFSTTKRQQNKKTHSDNKFKKHIATKKFKKRYQYFLICFFEYPFLLCHLF